MIKAVFFDMDGTVMEPNINWRELRRQPWQHCDISSLRTWEISS